MKIRSSTLHVLGICAVVAVLAGCAGQSQVTPTSVTRMAHVSDAGGESTGSNTRQRKGRRGSSPYTLVDLGTFGGPQSAVSTASMFGPAQILNNQGTVVGFADTATAGSFPGVLLRRTCCYVSRARLQSRERIQVAKRSADAIEWAWTR